MDQGESKILTKTKVAARRYDVYIQRTSPSDDDKLVVVQCPAVKSPLGRNPDDMQFSIKPRSLKMKLVCNDDKNVYTTTRNNIDDRQLFVCKFVNDRLVCQPVSQIVTLRPDFSHLNPKEEVDPREEIRPISIKFSTNDRHHAPSKVNLSKPDPDEVLEEYQECSFKNARGKYATSQMDRLFGRDTKPKVKADPDGMDVKPDVKFLSDIKPKVEKMDVDGIYSAETEATASQIPQKKADLLRQRVKECLTRAKLVSFEEVYQYLESYHEKPSGTSGHPEQLQLCVKTILDALAEYAVLVQGNWAIKSEVLYGDSDHRECTDVTGIPINHFTAARDYLLWLFDQNQPPLVSRPAYAKKVKLPDHDVLELFNQLAVFKPDLKKWQLKLPTDEKFLKRYSDRVDKQKAFWRIRRANKLRCFD